MKYLKAGAAWKIGIHKKRSRRVFLVLLGIGVLFAAGRTVDLQTYLETLQGWIRGVGPGGAVGYIVIYVTAMLIMLPGTPFTIAAAFLFGPLWGYVIMVIASTLAAVTGFFIGRHLAKERVENAFSDSEPFQKLKRIVEANHRVAIPFVHIMPIFPFSLTNYAFGLSRVSFWSFIFYSEIVFLPMNAILILGANAIYLAAVRVEISWGFLLGTMGAGLILLVLGFAGRRVFADPAAPSPAAPPEE